MRCCGSGMTREHPFSRSEEHTSELQSQSNLVCRLLLEKKNLMAEVAGEIDDLHSSVPLTPSSQQPLRAILASVINQNHFAGRGESIEHPTQSPLKLLHRLHLVVDRYDNREPDALCAVHRRSPLVLTGTKWSARLGPGDDLSRDSGNLPQRIALQRRAPMRQYRVR